MTVTSPGGYFLVAMATAFVATLPFGPINLTVVKTTVDHHRLGAIEFSFSASVVETGQALIAILFGLVINRFLANYPGFNLLVAAVFIGLAVYVFIHETHPSLRDGPEGDPNFVKRGVLLAMLNPQAIPFWIFAVTATTQSLGMDLSGVYLLFFLVGVFIGKNLALFGFILASDYLKSHLDESSQLVNRLLAVVLFIIGLIQIGRFLNA